jgi:hypothetical protein
VIWENCPVVLKGQFQGKEKCATIGLEAVADYNLWIWHNAFGFPGCLNNINIWERSPLFESMQDGSRATIDFPFTINNQQFEMLHYLVDGIYPPLARFLSAISDPTSKIASNFATKQEAARKDVEPAFGVLKVKFLCLKHPLLMHHRDDIFYVCQVCIAMHNMMVEARIEAGEEEGASFYAIPDSELTESLSERETDGSDDSNRDVIEEYGVGGFNPSNPEDKAAKYAMVQRRWEQLYDEIESKRLRDAVMNELYKNEFGEADIENSGDFLVDYDPLHM